MFDPALRFHGDHITFYSVSIAPPRRYTSPYCVLPFLVDVVGAWPGVTGAYVCYVTKFHLSTK